MTRLLTCGYETGDIAEAGISTIGASQTLTVVSTAPVPRAGSYCLKAATTSGTFAPTYKAFALPAAKTEVWLRFAFLSHTPTVEHTIASLSDSTAAVQTVLTYHPVDGLLRAYRGGSTALLGVASTAFAADTWHAIEWRTQILTTTTGATEVWLDGNRVVNFSGDNSQTTTLNVQTLSLGMTATASGTGTSAYVAYDDIAVNDTAGTLNNGRAGDGRVVLLVPNGAGSSTVLTRGGTDTGANYSQVNEIPPSLVQYVGSAVAGDRDLYAMGNLTMAVASINVVEAIVLAQNSDAGAGSIGPTIKSGATVNEATAIGLATAAGYVTSRWETDPATTAAWTATAVNALEAGVTVR